MKKIVGFVIFLAIFGSANAQESNTYKAQRVEAQEMRNTKVEENRTESRDTNKENVQTLETKLTDEQKEQMKELRDMLQDDLEEYREALENAVSEEARATIRDEMHTLIADYDTQIKEILGDNTEALNIFNERKTVLKEKAELLRQNREMRSDNTTVKRETVVQYRTAFVSRIGNALDNLSNDKLEQIVERIDSMIEDFETKSGISDERRDSMLAALTALKEIIEEKLETDNLEDDILDTVEALIGE
ncbi:hypothetical protein N9J72_00610 [Candidatus Gracilibacteria bacterium]|nr:hypothetical protein [Candidatus Gracilibacteria bacterium]